MWIYKLICSDKKSGNREKIFIIFGVFWCFIIVVNMCVFDFFIVLINIEIVRVVILMLVIFIIRFVLRNVLFRNWIFGEFDVMFLIVSVIRLGCC